MFKILKCRDTKERIGVILGAICFLPSYLIVFILAGLKHMILGIFIMCLTQVLWLASIVLSTWSLDIENRKLKQQLKELGGK